MPCWSDPVRSARSRCAESPSERKTGDTPLDETTGRAGDPQPNASTRRPARNWRNNDSGPKWLCLYSELWDLGYSSCRWHKPSQSLLEWQGLRSIVARPPWPVFVQFLQ